MFLSGPATNLRPALAQARPGLHLKSLYRKSLAAGQASILEAWLGGGQAQLHAGRLGTLILAGDTNLHIEGAVNLLARTSQDPELAEQYLTDAFVAHCSNLVAQRWDP
jgi:hypothetical protein